ncbi:MAG: hypothetical protein IPM88_14425 [Nitrospira sp.]|nr:hypothetical protein [Nitrospira sp.]
MNSLQDGNKVMQQQIDLLNQELRDAKKQAEHAQTEAKALQAEAKALGTKPRPQLAESKKLSVRFRERLQKRSRATDNIRVEEKGPRSRTSRARWLQSEPPKELSWRAMAIA